MSYKIGIDLDGTLVSTPESMVEYLNERLPINLTIDDITSYYFEDFLPDQFKWLVGVGFKDPMFWKKVEFYKGAAEVVDCLYNEGYELYFVTSSLPQNLRKKINHLARNLHIPKDYIEGHTVNIQHKQLLRLDILVDDALYQLVNDRNYASICINKPYNQTDDWLIPNFYRAYGWHDVYGYIKMIEKERSDVASP